ncbi:UDP-N-acetylmuramoyl-L-alanine--D-glutamate ligase [Desulfobacterota bacterium M19]
MLIRSQTRVLIVGLGKSGRSALRFCQGLGAVVSVSDAGAAEAEKVNWLAGRGVKYELGGHSRDFFEAAEVIIVSPGVPDLPLLREARQRGAAVIGELALAPDYLRTPVMAVTGTNGKTTVTTLLGGLLRAAGRKVFVGGNIGTPLTDYLSGPQEADWVVLEVSSFQLDMAGGFRPRLGVILNISPDHLDRYKNLEDYALSKMSLLRNQLAADSAVLNADDPMICRLLGENPPLVRRYYFGSAPGLEAVIEGGRIRLTKGPAAADYHLPAALASAPNPANAAAAILSAGTAGCGRADIGAGLEAFQPLAHRLTPVTEVNGVQYIDDSKATNIGAAAAALGSMERPVILIAGGLSKDGGYELLRPLIRKRVKVMLLIGEARFEMAAACRGLCPVELHDSLEGAVERAAELSESGDIVLLSPACASFDMFRSYGERGEVFQQAARKLAGKARDE